MTCLCLSSIFDITPRRQSFAAHHSRRDSLGTNGKQTKRGVRNSEQENKMRLLQQVLQRPDSAWQELPGLLSSRNVPWLSADNYTSAPFVSCPQKTCPYRSSKTASKDSPRSETAMPAPQAQLMASHSRSPRTLRSDAPLSRKPPMVPSTTARLSRHAAPNPRELPCRRSTTTRDSHSHRPRSWETMTTGERRWQGRLGSSLQQTPATCREWLCTHATPSRPGHRG